MVVCFKFEDDFNVFDCNRSLFPINLRVGACRGCFDMGTNAEICGNAGSFKEVIYTARHH